VGLIYGPSGSEKSSLVKAGLLPRLSDEVISVYVESTADETEARLLNGLRKSCRALDDDLSFKETLTALRRGQGVPVGKQVLIVLDQFEQWLHGRRQEEGFIQRHTWVALIKSFEANLDSVPVVSLLSKGA
jgi:hypothetical protein